jgi:transcriptional regulator with XRE-family HTH domain
MAKALNVSIPFVSNVEKGKTSIPYHWLEKLSDIFNLSDEEKKKLEIIIANNIKQIRIDIENLGINEKLEVIALAKKMNKPNKKK